MTRDQRPETRDWRYPIPLSPLPARPLVSILMPNYNYAHLIEEALDSLLNQSYDRWEVIVCDDGSVDTSPAVVQSYSARDDRVILIRQTNAGVGAALNTAFARSRGEVVCLLDADDYFETEKLATIVEKFLTNPDVGFVQHAMNVIDGDSNLLRRLPAEGVYEEGWIADRVRRRGGRWRSLPASALCFHRDVADLLFPMPAGSLRSMADAYLYMLAPLLTNVGFIDQPLAAYRLHGANLTGSHHLDSTVTSRFLDGYLRVFESIAEKSRQNGLPTLHIPEEKHLTFKEHRYMQALYAAQYRRGLLRTATNLIRRIISDDLYSPARKALGIATFSIAPLIPCSMRPAWIDLMLGNGVRRFRM